MRDELVFLALGGAGEIGMNLNLYGLGPPDRRQWLMIDLGITFADDSIPGVDVILPDPAFIEENRRALLGLVVTHAHEDHIGAVPYLWPRLQCPIYATPFTAALLRGKLEEAGLLSAVELHVIPLSGTTEIGPFRVELVTLTHSIPEPNGVIIRTRFGNILHTGDWKIDPAPLIGEATDEAALIRLGDEGVLAMVCDSTNVFVPGESGSETEVRNSLIELMRTIEGAIAVTSFASNVARLETIVEAARQASREVVLVGRSMHRMVQAARETGYLQDLPPFIDEADALSLPRERRLYLCTGSQGEARAALMRIAAGDHPTVSLEAGDTVIFSSRIIPGNERKIFELQNRLSRAGIRIVTEKDHFVHVSGHPARDELTRMYQWVRPKIAVPVHGEARHLVEHAALARELQIPHAPVLANGDLLRLAPGNPEIVDAVPAGRLLLDGGLIVPAEGGSVSERRKLSLEGYLGVTLVLDDEGEVLADPQIVLRGVPAPEDVEALKLRLGELAEEAVDRLSPRDLLRDEAIIEAVKRSLRRKLRDESGKRPVIDISIIRLD